MRDTSPIRPPHVRVLSAGDWLAALQDPRCELTTSFHGHSRVQSSWYMPNRRFLDHLIYLVTERTGYGQIEGRTVNLAPGVGLLMAPSQCHTFGINPGEPDLSVYHYRFLLRREDTVLRPPPNLSHTANAWDILPWMERLIDLEQTKLPYPDQRRRALLVLIGSWLLDHGQQAEPESRRFSPHQRQQLMAMVADSLAARPTPADLAAQMSLSADYFTRLFRATYGLAPRSFLVRERVRVASQRLLESTATISEVAMALGYDDLQHFSRQFKSVMGVTPRLYRQRATKPRQL